MSNADMLAEKPKVNKNKCHSGVPEHNVWRKNLQKWSTQDPETLFMLAEMPSPTNKINFNPF